MYLVFPILEVEQQAAVLGLVSWCDVLMDCIQPVLNLIGNLLHLVLRSVLQVTCIFTPVGRGRRWGKKEEAGGGKERGGVEEKGKRKRRGGEEGKGREGGKGKKKRGRRREGKRKRLKKNKGVIICLSALFLLQTSDWTIKRQGHLHIYVVCNKCVLHSQ